MMDGMNTEDKPFEIREAPRAPKALLKSMGKESFLESLSENVYRGCPRSDLVAHRNRFMETVKLHLERFGDRPVHLLRAPGRLNLFTEYLDMCRGDHMSTTIDGDIPLVVSPAEDDSDRVRIQNTRDIFPPGEFRIGDEVMRFKSAPWNGEATRNVEDNWTWRSRIYPCYGRKRGDSMNYVLAPYLRAAFEWPEVTLRGCDMTFGPSLIPIRAGTSSSSAVVVLSLLSLILGNRDRLPLLGVRQLCRFLGEAEWYVGTRGGANDQTTIFRNEADGILYNLHHLDLIDSRPLPWLEGVSVIICNSLWEADKALGARYIFNMRKGWMDLARDLLERVLEKAEKRLAPPQTPDPGWEVAFIAEALPGFTPPRLEKLARNPGLWSVINERFNHLGSLDETLLGVECPVIEELIRLLPGFITVPRVRKILGKTDADLERDYSMPSPDDGGYKPRNAAEFFFKENRIGRAIEKLLLEARAELDSGRLASDDPSYDSYRWRVADYLNALQDALRDLFQVSNGQIERLLAIARQGPGFMAGKLTGAGSGGCVCLLVERERADNMLAWLDEFYFGRPDNFKDYREALAELARSGEEEHRLKAAEMSGNLESALADPIPHRRIVTFSKGAGLV